MFDISKQYHLSVLVNGNPITEYFHDNNYFVEGREGKEFSLSVNNTSYEDIEVILAVDGLSILDGKEAGHKSNGFVIKAHTSNVFPGWTISKTGAKAFYFTGKSDSYAERTRTKAASNVGVVGAMVFRKKPVPLTYSGFRGIGNPAGDYFQGHMGASLSAGAIYNEANTGFGNNATTKDINNLGAGWGQTVQQNLVDVKFDRRDPENPDAILAMYYDDRKGLERRGIVLDRAKAYSDPFPAYNNSSYCKPPTK